MEHKLQDKRERVEMKRVKMTLLVSVGMVVTLGAVWYNQSDSGSAVASVRLPLKS